MSQKSKTLRLGSTALPFLKWQFLKNNQMLQKLVWKGSSHLLPWVRCPKTHNAKGAQSNGNHMCCGRIFHWFWRCSNPGSPTNSPPVPMTTQAPSARPAFPGLDCKASMGIICRNVALTMTITFSQKHTTSHKFNGSGNRPIKAFSQWYSLSPSRIRGITAINYFPARCLLRKTCIDLWRTGETTTLARTVCLKHQARGFAYLHLVHRWRHQTTTGVTN